MYKNNNESTVRQYSDRISETIKDKPNKSSDLKRAFTVIPSEVSKKPTTSIEYVEQLPQIEPLKSNAELEQTVDVQEEWPSLEQLEALIRGKDSTNSNDVEWIELPLNFNKQTNISTDVEPIHNTKHVHETYIFEQANESNEPLNALYNNKLNELPRFDSLSKNNVSDYNVLEQNTSKITVHSPSWGKVALAVTSSVITGVLIGYVLLLAVFGVKVWPVNIITERVGQVEQPVLSTEPIQTKDTKETELIPIENVNSTGEIVLPDEQTNVTSVDTVTIEPSQTFNYTVLQAGVFSKENTRQAMIDSLKAKGYPAAAFKTYEGQHVVFAGIASNQNETYQLNHMSNTDIYRKSYSIHVPTLSTDNAIDAELQQWIYNVHDLLTSYMKLSQAQFEQTSLSSIYENSYSLLKQKSQQVVEETVTLKEKLTDEGLQNILEWHEQELRDSETLIAIYQENPTASSLFALQQQLLDILAYETEWFMNL